MTATTRRKLAAVLMAMVIFACLGAVTTAAVGRPVEIGAFNAVLIGAGIGLFEEFYVQRPRGNWMREMHPLRSIFIYILVVIVLYLIALHVTHLVLGRLDDLPVVYRRLPYGTAFFTAFSIVGILMIRVAHFIGLRTLLDLVIGTYHRPVEERKVLLFLDINGSTALAERLGALTIRSFVRKFLSDVSQPVVDYGGEIYLYKGDGLIAIWNWADAFKADAILKAVDAMFAAIAKERDVYQRLFGVVPGFRVGIHGGAVIVSEQGDAKRSIGIYGDAINIAAARSHNVRCVISEVVAQALADRSRVRQIGTEQVKGISAPVAICEYASG
jgi:adenylate cyclase